MAPLLMAPDPTTGALWRRASVEERVLFGCMRQDLDAAWRARLVALGGDPTLAWPMLLRVAVKHQVAPLVQQNLAAAGVLAHAPASVQAGFHHEVLGNLGAKATMRRALVEALAYFAGEGIEVLAVKGTSLDLRLFTDAASTVSGDIDLLLRPDWHAVDPSVHARVAAFNAGTPVVDVDFVRHPDLVLNGILPVDFAAIWARSTSIAVDGQPVHLMCVEHELVCATINSARKRFFRLKSLLELSELLHRHPALDHDEVARCARAWRCNGIAYAALRAAAATVGAAVPAPMLRALGIGRVHAGLLDALVARMSFCRLATLHGGLRLGGKRLGRGLLLPYASLGVRAGVRALRRALRQMGGTRAAPHGGQGWLRASKTASAGKTFR